ncbi:MAG: CbtA family protein [Acidimicrobiia bacterium]
MTRNLLVCGLIAGLCAGLLATGFARIVGEPAVDAAIAFEESTAPPSTGPEEEPLVTRGVQSGIGLLTATVVFGLAIGGLFALAFAFAYGRAGSASPFVTALWLAAGAYAVFFLVPFLKYPANPPAVGNPDTIDRRTALYWVMVAISLAAAVAALRLRGYLATRTAPHVATVISVASFIVIVLIAGLLMPSINEVPEGFPAVTLWEFRQATLGMQLVLWATIGIVFAFLAQRVMTRSAERSSPRSVPATLEG